MSLSRPTLASLGLLAAVGGVTIYGLLLVPAKPFEEMRGYVYLAHAIMVRARGPSLWLSDPSGTVRLHSDGPGLVLDGIAPPVIQRTGEPGGYEIRPGPNPPPGGDYLVRPDEGGFGFVVAAYRRRKDDSAESAQMAADLERQARGIDRMLAKQANDPRNRPLPDSSDSFKKLADSLREGAARKRLDVAECRHPAFLARHARFVEEKGGRLMAASGDVEIEFERGADRREPAGAILKPGDLIDLRREPGQAVAVVSPAVAD